MTEQTIAGYDDTTFSVRPNRPGGCYRWAILEVDGYWHKPEKRAKEHERERLFERSGVRVHRFDANLCELDPQAVVSELMDLMSH